MNPTDSVRSRLSLAALGCLLGVLACPGVTRAQEAAATWGDATSGAFLKKYCFECHNNTTAEAKLSLESLAPQAGPRWVQVYDKLRLSQMPPKDEPQPTAEERQRVADQLRQHLHKASLALQESEGRVVLRRLNATEYETTLRDLLGKQVSVRDLLPADTTTAGFDNVSAALDVSSVHLLRYQEAAEKALKSVIPRAEPKKVKVRLTGREVVGRSRHAALGEQLRLDGDTLLIYSIPYNHIALGTAKVPQRGRYTVRASVYALGTQGKPLPVRFSDSAEWGRDPDSVLAVRNAPADKATILEQECELQANRIVDVMAWSLPTQRQFGDRKLAGGKPLEEYTGPVLAIEWLEIEGPLDPFPPAGYTRLFGDLPLKAKHTYTPLQVESANPQADAERLMRSFLPVAFRRPVRPELVDYYVQVVRTALDRKLPFEEAMLLGYRTALCSPHFLFLTEPMGTVKDRPAALDDYAVAARLAYFLWSTHPDDELLQRAAKGELATPAVLEAQVERLLKDPRASRFTENFAGQWLDLRKINDTTPSPQTYGEFDDFLFWSMPAETTRFFEEILGANRSLTEFVHSDWSFLNERLAKHYGIPGVFGGEMRRVSLPADCHRGGVLTQASILKVTADGTKTSPILRGKWVLERILGQPPAPPPPNVAAVEPDIRGATSIRQQLEKHRSTAWCQACHRHIDPPGFALESFDPIGGWRDFYRGTVYKREAVVKLANYPGREVVRGLDVEKGDTTSDGRAFRDIDEYKQILLADKDQLARTLAEKLLIYGTGAEIQFADREVVEQLVAKSRAKNYGFRSLVQDVVQSRIFLSK